MISKKFESKLIFRVFLLLITLSLPVLTWTYGVPELLVFLAPVIAFQVYQLLRFQKQAQEDLRMFIESVQYRDFSRFFNESSGSEEIQHLHKAFNEINSTFRIITREKEIQHQHLQQILELVNTGIITYDVESGEVLLMNEALKKLLHVPFMQHVLTLAKREKDLFAEIQALEPGQTKLTSVHAGNLDQDTFSVLLAATVFQSEGNQYKLVALQNVHQAIDETESKAWEKLLNVLTHEIMNSVAPISSLADTLKTRLAETEVSQISEDDIGDLEEGITTIKRRSEGLLKFAETYRNLSKITQLHAEKIYLKELFNNLQRLMQPTVAQKQITFRVQVKDPQISLQADTNLLDQVLINLLVNAMDAVKESQNPTITLAAELNAENRVVIKVRDNGTGMPKEVQEKIFIPFFSTKKQGSGIGLSLCKQIVLLHGGTIQVHSETGAGTVFTLKF